MSSPRKVTLLVEGKEASDASRDEFLDNVMARVRRIERRSAMNMAASDAYNAVLGSSKRKARTQASGEQDKWIKWIDEDGCDRSYQVKHMEAVNKCKTDAELKKLITDTLARIEAKDAEVARMSKGVAKCFRLLSGEDHDDDGSD